MKTFGELLRKYRLNTINPDTKKKLTQEKLAEFVANEVGIKGLSGATVSYWESGKHEINKNHRETLVSLIKVLRCYGGITSRNEANALLEAGHYRTLDNEECQQIDEIWRIETDEPVSEQHQKLFKESEFEFVREDSHRVDQDLLLPSRPYTQLFGVEETVVALLEQLRQPYYPQLTAIVGLGGLGKTSLAYKVAEQAFAEGLFERLVWVTIAGRGERESVLSEEAFLTALGEQLFSGAFGDNSIQGQREHIYNTLKLRKHLIIIDNLEREEDVANLLPLLSEFAGANKFLLTTRQQPPLDANVYLFLLKELSLSDASDLLRHRAQEIGLRELIDFPNEKLRQIYEVTGGHPLALRLIPQLLKFRSFSQLAKSWQRGNNHNIAKIYDRIYESLWGFLSDNEKQLLEVMRLVAYIGTTAEHLIAICGLDEDEWETAISNLINYALIELYGTIEDRRFSIHRLTEQFLVSHLANEQHLFKECIIANLYYWQERVATFNDGTWHELDNDRQNIYIAIDYLLTLPAISVDEQSLLVDLSEKVYQFVRRRGYWYEWIPILEKLCRWYADMPQWQGQLLKQLGNLYAFVNRLDLAIETHQQVLVLAQQVEDEVLVASIYLSLGINYWYKRAYAEAEQQAKNGLDICADYNLIGSEQAHLLHLLAVVARSQERWPEAEAYCRQALALWQELAAPVEMAQTLNILAISLQNQGQVEVALQCYEEADYLLTDTAAKVEKINIALSRGALYFSLKEWNNAYAIFAAIDRDYLQEAKLLNLETKVLHNLGLVALKQERLTEAEIYLQQSLQGRRQIKDNWQTVNTLSALMELYVLQKVRSKAMKIYWEAKKLLSIYKETDAIIRRRQGELERLRVKLERNGDNSISRINKMA